MSNQSKPTLEDTKKYYQLVVLDKMEKEEAVKQLSIKRRHYNDVVRLIENSDEYKLVAATLDQANRAQLRDELMELKRAKVKAYKSLLNKGEELMGETGNVDEQIRAQENQRRNLDVDVIERSSAWDGDSRNKIDHGDVMEGVIIR